MFRISFNELQRRIERVLAELGLTPERAALGAQLIAETDRDGVQTHGIARLPRFAEMVRLGRIMPKAVPRPVAAFGGLERWTGDRGPGNLAAHAMTARAMELAKVHGIGAVALRDTTHWMRGGSYGWQAAEAGYVLLAWTNTMPNLPPWGGSSPALGNNPLVIAVPRRGGGEAGAGDPDWTKTGSSATASEADPVGLDPVSLDPVSLDPVSLDPVGLNPVSLDPVVLDIAMSQFSYGGLAGYRQRGESLPVPGGFNAAGELTSDPRAIEASQRALPIGYWKGSGLALVLDLLAAMLAGGRATYEIKPDPLAEVGVSQVFLAISPAAVGSWTEMEQTARGCIDALHAAAPATPGVRPRFPGERTSRVRDESLRLGVALDEATWAAFTALERN